MTQPIEQQLLLVASQQEPFQLTDISSAPIYSLDTLSSSGQYSLSQSTKPLTLESENIKPEGLGSTIQKRTSINVPVILKEELTLLYCELGDALNELREVDEDSEWQIESDVYQRACYTATVLMEHAYPAPRMFTHGAKSVVFNWENGETNLYLTISSDTLSALVSTPKKIERRVQLASRQLGDSLMLLPIIGLAKQNYQALTIKTSSGDPNI